jgi:hypothetical protein
LATSLMQIGHFLTVWELELLEDSSSACSFDSSTTERSYFETVVFAAEVKPSSRTAPGPQEW